MKRHLLLFIICICILFPTKVYAVDYTISHSTIDVHVQENGHVEVVEFHTYDFESKFNGMTREIDTKKGTKVEGFKAFENEKALKVEQDKNKYSIHRKGKNEQVTMKLQYVITNAIERFEDGGEFYWTFFTNGNESDFEDLRISIHPPSPTANVAYLGYFRAFNSEKAEADGTVHFELGRVSNSDRVDVRVVYDGHLFAALPMKNGTVINKIEQERLSKEQMIARQQKKREWKEQVLAPISILFIGVFGGAVIALFSRRRKGRQYAMERLASIHFQVPSQKLSMPATIYFTNGGMGSHDLQAAALLDLIRKGLVRQVEVDSFELMERETEFSHEEVYIQWLFSTIGDGKNFSIEQLQAFTKEERNYKAYNEGLQQWQQTIREEVKNANVFQKNPLLKWLFIGLGITFLTMSILFFSSYVIVYGLIAVFFSISSLCIGLFYKERSSKGHLIAEEWKHCQMALQFINEADWESTSKDDQYRICIYNVGMDDKYLQKQFATTNRESSISLYDSEFSFNPIFITSSFQQASTNTSVHSSSSSNSGGVGGSGGGAGAF